MPGPKPGALPLGYAPAPDGQGRREAAGRPPLSGTVLYHPKRGRVRGPAGCRSVTCQARVGASAARALRAAAPVANRPNTAAPLPVMAAVSAPAASRRSRRAPTSGRRATTAASRSFWTSAATSAALVQNDLE